MLSSQRSPVSEPNEEKAHSGYGLVGALETSNRSPSDIHGLDTIRIVELFKGFGYTCKPQGKLRGISGVLHEFDFVCTKLITGEKLILQSLLPMKESVEKLDVEVVKLRLSTYDCTPDVCLVVTSHFTDRVQQMASLYRLTVIDSSSENPYDQIESLLRLQA